MNFLDACYTLLNYVSLIVTHSYGAMKHKMLIQTITYFPVLRNSLEIRVDWLRYN